MPLCNKNGQTLLFVHIPKTGGTSVNHFLEANAVFSLRFKGIPPGLKCPPQHLEAESLRAILPINSIDGVFSIVRHPENRLVSEFLSRYRRSNYRFYIESIPFDSVRESTRNAYFSKWVLKSFSRYRSDPYYLSNHIRPQSHFMVSDMHRIFRLEDGFNHAIEFICQTLLLPDDQNPAERLNSSPSHAIVVPYLIRRKLEEFYAEDYERFGYKLRS